jgi:hypothetical protein
MEWISVEDEMPEEGEIIIGRGSYDFDGRKLIATAVKLKGGMWWRDNNGYGFTVSCHPTHWIPLPDDKSTL